MDKNQLTVFGCICILCLISTGCSSTPSVPTTPTSQAATVLPLEEEAPQAISPPITTPDDALLEEINAYTPDSPLTDRGKILQVLQLLQLRESEWYSRTGWYEQINGYDSKSFGHMVFLTHVIDSNQACQEQLFYYLKGEEIWPFIIRLADGAMGSYSPLFEGKVTAENVQPAEQAIPCDLGDGASLWVGNEPVDFMLHDETLRFQGQQQLADQPGVNVDMFAWTEEVEGVDCFVWETQVRYENPVASGSGVYMDPKTNTLQHISGTDRYIYVALDTGLMLIDHQDLHLLNGELVTGETKPNIFNYYEELPIELSDVYERMAGDVQTVLDQLADNPGE